MKNLLIKFLIIFSPLVQAKESIKMDHAYFLLELGNHEGVFTKGQTKDKLRVFKEPHIKSDIIHTYNTKKIREENLSIGPLFEDFYKGFKINRITGRGLIAYEKKKDFYRAPYRGGFGWIYKEDVYKVSLLLEELDDVFAISKKEKLYSNPSFKSKQIQVPQLEKHSFRDFDVSYLDHKIIDRKLWIKIRIGKIREVCGGGGSVYDFKLKKPVVAWIYPFTPDGDRGYVPLTSC